MSAYKDEQDKWATFLEFLKATITLSGGVIGAFAILYSDPTRIPKDSVDRILLLAVIVAAIGSLGAALVSVLRIHNSVIDTVTAQEKITQGTLVDPQKTTKQRELDRAADNTKILVVGTLVCLGLGFVGITAFVVIKSFHVEDSNSSSLLTSERLRGDIKQLRQDLDNLKSSFNTSMRANLCELAEARKRTEAVADMLQSTWRSIGRLEARLDDLAKQRSQPTGHRRP